MNTEALRRAHAETDKAYAHQQASEFLEDMGTPSLTARHTLIMAAVTNGIEYGRSALIDRIEALEAENARLATLAKANNDLARIEMTHRKQLAFQRAELANAMEALISQYGHRLPADFLLALTQMLMRHGDTARAALGEQS